MTTSLAAFQVACSRVELANVELDWAPLFEADLAGKLAAAHRGDGTTTTTDHAGQPPIEDTRHRIKNILDVYPASTWTPEEARHVLDALSLIVRGRHASSEVDGSAR